MNTREETGILTHIERKRNSINGNPRYAVSIDAGGHWSDTYLTQVDGSVGYEVTNFKRGSKVTLTIKGKRESIVAIREVN